MILKSRANIICLQECTNKFFKVLFTHEGILKKFKSFGF